MAHYKSQTACQEAEATWRFGTSDTHQPPKAKENPGYRMGAPFYKSQTACQEAAESYRFGAVETRLDICPPCIKPSFISTMVPVVFGVLIADAIASSMRKR